ncbi:MAG: hypothetical protein H7240_00420 [Glaciimonas sp.]|nr:hypothetical protein [Glaciimonas sp.]
MHKTYVWMRETMEKVHARIKRDTRYGRDYRIGLAGKERRMAWMTGSCERGYCLCAITEVARIAQIIRDNWTIENQQYWILDAKHYASER